jgi:hypothetical protein
MRKVGSKGAPSKADFIKSAKTRKKKWTYLKRFLGISRALDTQ